MASAAFSINGTSVPQSSGLAVEVAGGATVTLTLTSTAGVETVSWSIAGVSGATVSSPTITRSGTPLGATATFTVAADPGDGAGLAYGVRCDVRDGNGDVTTAYGVVGIPNAAGAVPAVAGEQEGWRHATLGWTPLFNSALMGFPYYSGSATTTNTSAHTAATVLIPPGKLARVDCVWSAYDATAGHRKYRQSAMVVSCNAAGTDATQLGSTVDVIDEADDDTWTSTMVVAGSAVTVNYTGDATNSVAWRIAVWRNLMGI